MLNIYIARHGQNEDNANGVLNGHRDLPLTELGRAQARELAQGIKEKGLTFDAVLSSPLCRAYETGEIVTNALGLPKPEILLDLIERDFGTMTGKLIKDIELLCAPDIIKTKIITYFISPEGAETFPNLLARAKKVIDEVQKKYTDGSVLLVCHGDIGKFMYASYYGFDWMWALTQFHFGNSELLLLSPDSSADDTHVISIKQHNH